MPPFERPHHQRIAWVLDSVDGGLLRSDRCWFGRGTAIALTHGKYRESIDIDFLVSDQAGYRDLGHRLVGARDLGPITLPARAPAALEREVRADQYGIRMFVAVGDVPVKLEIVHEGRIALDVPGRNDRVGGIATLSRVDTLCRRSIPGRPRLNVSDTIPVAPQVPDSIK
ncbi:MAG: nucleotidyl transferase AbiEii/AbiGii toxin family protein [Rhodanobacteraceae bacterium]